VLVGVGNVDAAIIAGMIGTWMLRDRPRALGILLAVLISVKLTPAVLVVWLFATRRWQALAWCGGTGLALAALTAAILGPDIFANYLGVIAGASLAGRPWAFALILFGSPRGGHAYMVPAPRGARSLSTRRITGAATIPAWRISRKRSSGQGGRRGGA
jgi:hypothetical protein